MQKRLYLIAILALASEFAWARPQLRVNSTLIKTSQDGRIWVSFHMGCRGTFEGFVVNEQGDTLQIGALVRAESVACTNISPPLVRPLPGIHAGSFKYYQSLAHREYPGNLVSLGFNIIHLSPLIRSADTNLATKSSGGIRIQGSYQSRCGRPVGVILGAESDTGLKLGFLEYIGLDQPVCDYATNIASLEIVRPIHSKWAVTALGDLTARWQRPYQIKLTKLKSKSLTRHRDGGYSFQYWRGCQEAPLGATIEVNRREKRIYWAMTIANYPDMKCKEKVPMGWTTFRTKAVKVPKGYQILFRQPRTTKQGVVTDLIVPHEIELTSHHIRAHFLASCGKVLGLTIVERGNTIYLGLAQRSRRERVAHCRQPMNALTFELPRLNYGQSVVEPLRLVDNF